MKLTDFTKEQLMTKKFRRHTYLSGFYTVMHKGELIVVKDGTTIGPLLTHAYLADDWEMVEEPLRLEVGKRYKDRCGCVHLVIAINTEFEKYPVTAREAPRGTPMTYTLDGKYYSGEDGIYNCDLVEEVEG